MEDEMIVDIARKRLCGFLQTRPEISENPFLEMEYVAAIGDETTGNRIFCVFKFRTPDSGAWRLGVAGGFTDEESEGSPEDFECPIAYSSFCECPDDRNELISAAFIVAIFAIQRDSARDALFVWLAERGRLPSKIEHAFVINGERSQNRRFFAFKVSYGDELFLGVAGGYETYEDKADSIDCVAAFSDFAEFPADKDEAIDAAFEAAASALNSVEFLWQDAYRANPHVYEMEDGGLLVGFALTEDTDSLFPLVPEEHWAIEGKTINKWIISIVSITKDGVIGTIEYHEAIKRLEKHFLAEKDGWALIRALTLDELEELFDGLPRDALK